MATEIKEGDTDTRLRDARNWYECAYEWRIVSYAMHAHARLNAKAAGRVLYYIPSIDIPAVRMNRKDFDDMRGQPNISVSAKFPGVLPVYIGMEMILTESYLPPRVVRGAPVEVVDIELHPMEPDIRGRDSIASHGCVVLFYMPKCIYVRLNNCKDIFLAPEAGAPQLSSADLQGAIAVEPVTRSWRYKSKTMQAAVAVTRTQCPLVAEKAMHVARGAGQDGRPGLHRSLDVPRGTQQ
jgi:hypothetical protein